NDDTGGPVPIPPAAGTTFAIVNGAPISVPWSYTDKSGNTQPQAGAFLEEGVDLTALGLNSNCFTSFFAETRTSATLNASSEDFALGSFSSCITPTVTTTVLDALTHQPPTGALGESVLDTATVSGSPFTPTGTVTYTFTGQLAGLTPPAGWTVVNTTTWTDTVTLSAGMVPNSPLTPPLPAGGYQFQAGYSGEPGKEPSSETVETPTVKQAREKDDTTLPEALTLQAPRVAARA